MTLRASGLWLAIQTGSCGTATQVLAMAPWTTGPLVIFNSQPFHSVARPQLSIGTECCLQYSRLGMLWMDEVWSFIE